MKQLLILLLLPSFLFAQTDSTDIIIGKMMKDQRITGLALAVVKNGGTFVNKGYGLANVEHNAPVTSETVIRLGSVSKQFFTTDKIQPDSVIIKAAYSLPLDFKTGDKYQYCNIGYYMIAEIIARVSKKPWQDYIGENIFIPAGNRKHFTVSAG